MRVHKKAAFVFSGMIRKCILQVGLKKVIFIL